VNRKSAPIPEPIAQLQRQLDQFRGSQSGRTKLQEALWHAAVDLARQSGVYPVSRPLGLDYARRLAEKQTLRPWLSDLPEWRPNGLSRSENPPMFLAMHAGQ